MMLGRKPLVKICAIIVPSQRRPIVTCSPWQPTSAKKADRNALRSGPCALRDHLGELVELEAEKAEAEAGP